MHRPLALLLLLFVSPASAQTYPARLVEIVVPFAAGGGTDLIARVLAERLSDSLRQRFVVISRPGASTNIGTAAVANAPADGYTLLLRPLNVETLSTYIYQYATRGNFEDGALAALLIVAAGIVPVIRMARYSDLALMPEAAPQ